MQEFQLSPTPGEELRLAPKEVHVWRVLLDADEETVRKFQATLDSDERARANQFAFARSRNEFVVTRGALRELLGQYLGSPPAELKLQYGSKGKPSLLPPLNSQIQFSVSHSHGLALLAFAAKLQVGVDVEQIRPHFATLQIAERYFSSQEVAELRVLPPALQPEGFFLCWTRKEAYIKALGEGLHVPLQSFRVSLTPGQPERLNAGDPSRWKLVSIQPAPGFVGALVAEGTEWNLRLFEFQAKTSKLSPR
jgi:4'-phosphopantetheinyl transferase